MKKKDFAHQVDSFDYRGFHFDVYSDPAEQQFFTFYKNELVELGIMNQNYLRYIKSLVDFDMDVIEMFSGELVGAKLE